jgi:GWxTD domain-containing protein
MNFLKTFIETPLAGAIGWTLLHSLWEGAIISGALAAVLVAVRSPRIRYAAASTAMLMMFIGFGFTLARMMPEKTHVQLPPGGPAFHSSNTAIAGATSDFANPGLAAVAPWLAPFWIAGVFLIYLRRVTGCISVQRLRRRGVCCVPERWQKELARLSAQLLIAKPILLLESCFAEVPMVLGHVRPLILLPVGLLAGLSPAQIEAVLLHELAHIRRHDYLVNVLQRLVEGLLFYHPATWWISRVMRAERENCCDDVVVSINGDAHEYASALAALEQNRLSGLEPAVTATGGNLMKRIRRLLSPAKQNSASAPFLAAAIFITTAAVSLAAWQSEPQQRSSGAVQMQTDGTAASPYSKWLNEDVVYIIDDAERATFLRLTTDEERDKFVEQFWLRRNPAPGTPTNKFKEEHYRRIAYANAHFGTPSGIPGWRTDRGHVYIVYGPPDEMEVHPTRTPNSRTIEVWMYKHVNGIGDYASFTFIDRSGHGDFHLAPGTPQPAPPAGTSLNDVPNAARSYARRAVYPVPTVNNAGVGPHIKVAEITFHASTIDKTEMDLDAFAREIGGLTNLRPTDWLEEVKERTRQFWQSHGFFKVQVDVDSKLISSTPDEQVFSVTANVNAGAQYHLKRLEFSGAKVFTSPELEAMMPIKPGEIFSTTQVRKGLDAIRAGYVSRGYKQYVLIPDTTLDDSEHTVNLKLNVLDGPQSK